MDIQFNIEMQKRHQKKIEQEEGLAHIEDEKAYLISAAKRILPHCIEMGGLSVLASVLFADEYPHIAEWMAQNEYCHNLDRLWESVLARTAEAA